MTDDGENRFEGQRELQVDFSAETAAVGYGAWIFSDGSSRGRSSEAIFSLGEFGILGSESTSDKHDVGFCDPAFIVECPLCVDG